MVRHVCSERTNAYWKESYHCIRTWYPTAHILIIDDSSHRDYLKEDIVLSHCTVIYDTTHKGSAELLPYYYFHLLYPFDTAVILHDSTFIQRPIDFTLEEGESCRFLWSFQHWFDEDIVTAIEEVLTALPSGPALLERYHQKTEWNGCFGVMSVIQWNFLDHIQRTEDLFARFFPIITTRHYRHALERCMAVLLTHYFPTIKPSMYGDIHQYIKWGITFEEYQAKDWINYPIMKVWTAR